MKTGTSNKTKKATKEKASNNTNKAKQKAKGELVKLQLNYLHMCFFHLGSILTKGSGAGINESDNEEGMYVSMWYEYALLMCNPYSVILV